MTGGIPNGIRVLRAKDGWHVVEDYMNGLHPDYRSVSGPYRVKRDAEAAIAYGKGWADAMAQENPPEATA